MFPPEPLLILGTCKEVLLPVAVPVALPAPFLLAKRSANFMASGPRI